MGHERLQHPGAESLALTLLRNHKITDVGVHRVIGDRPHEAERQAFASEGKTGGVGQRLRNLLDTPVPGPVGGLKQRRDGRNIEGVSLVSEKVVIAGDRHAGSIFTSVLMEAAMKHCSCAA